MIKTGRYGLGGGGDTPSLSNTDVFSEFLQEAVFRATPTVKEKTVREKLTKDDVHVTLLI